MSANAVASADAREGDGAGACAAAPAAVDPSDVDAFVGDIGRGWEAGDGDVAMCASLLVRWSLTSP